MSYHNDGTPQTLYPAKVRGDIAKTLDDPLWSNGLNNYKSEGGLDLFLHMKNAALYWNPTHKVYRVGYNQQPS